MAWLDPVRLSPRPSRSIRFGDLSEANGRVKPRQKQTAHAFVLYFKVAVFTGLYKMLQTAGDYGFKNPCGCMSNCRSTVAIFAIITQRSLRRWHYNFFIFFFQPFLSDHFTRNMISMLAQSNLVSRSPTVTFRHPRTD